MRTLAHKPPATRDAPDAPDAHDARAARRLAVLREVDLPTHEALTLALPALIEQPGIEAELATLVDLLLQVAAEDPAASLVLARRLDAMQAALSDLVSLRKWALHGLQRHRDDAARRLHFFEWIRSRSPIGSPKTTPRTCWPAATACHITSQASASRSSSSSCTNRRRPGCCHLR